MEPDKSRKTPEPSKDVPGELAKAYDPKLVEKKWYQTWMKNGYFRASSKSKKNLTRS